MFPNSRLKSFLIWLDIDCSLMPNRTRQTRTWLKYLWYDEPAWAMPCIGADPGAPVWSDWYGIWSHVWWHTYTRLCGRKRPHNTRAPHTTRPPHTITRPYRTPHTSRPYVRLFQQCGRNATPQPLPSHAKPCPILKPAMQWSIPRHQSGPSLGHIWWGMLNHVILDSWLEFNAAAFFSETVTFTPSDWWLSVAFRVKILNTWWFSLGHRQTHVA